LCGSIIGERQVSHVGVALTFGLVVLAMIYAVGDVSGARWRGLSRYNQALMAGVVESLIVDLLTVA
jgi:hypothetical protein